ncbi:flavin-containing monooxygenase [Sciscionella marina]|uniref:flavin-containing monooxygenase n=1 Tax=Sciscionella marina TaxID=508770 RepID=UPI00039DCA26|nr:NAD(P)/FAD-dependent oxidoreductase [Sciscionella marina]
MDHEVIIVGAGFSGIGMGMRLAAAGIEDFLILESGTEIGGTWRDNTYPGVAVDTPLVYSYPWPWAPAPKFSRAFPPGHEIRAYAERCVAECGLEPHIRFGAQVTAARFEPDRDTWLVELADGDGDSTRYLRTRFLIPATGVLARPRPPEIPGLEDYAGTLVHSADWDPEVELADKAVAVIGTGASALQLIPKVARRARSLAVYQRTPIWVFPKLDPRFPRPLRTLFDRVPAAQRAVRTGALLAVEAVFTVAALQYTRLPFVAHIAERICTMHLRAQVPDPELRRKLTPDYGFGCKRPSMSNSYLRAFTKNHVELVTDPIGKITADGVLGSDGRERRAEVLILATGFLTTERGNIPSFPVYGSEGRELADFWAEHRYQAYEGASLPVAPNLWLMFGPYAFTGASYFGLIEAVTNHILRCIEYARGTGSTRVTVRAEANDRYFATMRRRLRYSVFHNNCAGANSYYFDARGDAPFLRPTTTYESIWRSKHFSLADYEFSP